MKKLLLYIFAIFILLFTSCTGEKNNDITQNPVIVEVKTLYQEKSYSSISYVGIVNSDSIKKYSLKTSGKIKSINVQIGQAVNAGDTLIELDKSDLKFQVDAAKMQSDSAYSQYKKSLTGVQSEDIKAAELSVDKAQVGYDFAEKTYKYTKKLYEEEAVSETNYKEAELNFNLALKDLEQAKELLKKAQGGTREEDISSLLSQYKLAETNYKAISKLYDDATIVSDINGFVVDILYEVGEIAPEGYPIIVVQSKNQIVKVGVTSEDVALLSIGMSAKININGLTYDGEIVNIDQTPDEISRTFNVDIIITGENKKFYIGSICNVEIKTGTTESMWLEIPYILNDGRDYVYVVENNMAVRKNITTNEIKNDKVSVTGLANKAILITNGAKQVKDGYKVEITKNR